MKIDFFRHPLKEKDLKEVKKVIHSKILTTGSVSDHVEKMLSKYLNIKQTVLTSSWTSGAICTLMALNIKKGDEVIIPASTFVATANVIELLGAKPIFIDIDPDTLLMDYNQTIKNITKRTKVIMPVHIYGNMFDVKKLKSDLNKKNKKIYIIEDCAHSIESKLDNWKPGAYSDAAIFSFYATKNITCGEGGAVISNNQELIKRIRLVKNFGLTHSAKDKIHSKKFIDVNMNILGIKANLPDLLSCLLINQIKNINTSWKKRRSAFKIYEKFFSKTNVRRQVIPKNCKSAHHVYTIGVHKKIRAPLINYLKKNNIGCTINWRSIVELDYYKKKYNLKSKNFPNSVQWGQETISLPFFPDIKKKEQAYVCKIVKDFLNK